MDVVHIYFLLDFSSIFLYICFYKSIFIICLVSPYDLIIPEHVKGNRFRRTANGHEEPLQYKVKAFGEEYHLELFPNEDLLPTGEL